VSKEVRIIEAVNSASEQVFESSKKIHYSFVKLAEPDLYDSEFIDSVGLNRGAVLGKFAVGDQLQLPRLVIDRKDVQDHYGLSLIEKSVTDGYEKLSKVKPLVPNFGNFVKTLLQDSSMYFDDPNSTHLIAGIYALSRDGGDSYEPWLAYNSELDNIPFSLRESVLRHFNPDSGQKHNDLSKRLANPTQQERTDLTLSAIKTILPKDPTTFFGTER
jgi:hypothetical protein